MEERADQDMAYERAVLAARSEPRLGWVVDEAFLQEDVIEAFERFRASEHWSRVRRLLQVGHVERASRVLEVGGGRGLLSAALALEGYAVTLCEINPSAVCGAAAATDLMRRLELDVEVVNEPLAVLAARQERYRVVICRAVLHHMDDMLEALRLIYGLLDPRGHFIASDEPTIRHHRHLAAFRRDHPFVEFGVNEQAYRISHYKEALRRAGFSGLRVCFPVSLSNYRRHLRPDAVTAGAAVRYGLYRAHSIVAHPPGDVRAFLARRPG